MMVWPFISIILYTKFNFSPIWVGVVLSVSIAISSIVSFYSGFISDKIGRIKIIMLGCVISALAYLILGISVESLGFIIGTLLANTSWALVNNPIKAVISDLIDEPKLKEQAMHLRYLFLNAGAAVGPFIGVKLGFDVHSLSFFIVSVSYMIFMIPIYVLGKSITLETTNKLSLNKTVKILLNDRVFLLLVVNNIVMMFIFGNFDSTLPQLITSLQFSGYVELLASLIMLHAVTLVVMQLPISMMMNKFTLESKLKIGSFLLISAELNYFFAVKYYDAYSLWYSAVFIMSLAQTILFPCLNIFIDRLAPNHLRGVYFGASSLYSIGFAMAPLVGGVIIGLYNGEALYQLLTLLSFTMLGLFVYIFKIKDCNEVNIRKVTSS